MASELQRGVQRHREQFLVSAPIHKGRPSLFLSPKDAAAVDIADIYDTAVKGLRVLAQYESRFQPYFRTLLKESSKDVQRELKTTSENEELDREVSKFLELLSPYAAEHSAHTVMEYFIRRYRVNELNADALIRCVLPFHDTKIFAKVIELSKIDGSMWAVLQGVKKSGSPLPRSMLTAFARKSNSILATLTSIARSAFSIGAAGNVSNPLLSSGVNRIVSFYTAVVVELSDNRTLDDAQLRILYPYLVDGIRSPHETPGRPDINLQWSRSSCIILSQLSRTTKLAGPFINGILSAMFSEIASESKELSLSKEESCSGNLIKGFVMLAQLQRVSIDRKLLNILLSDGLVVFLSVVDNLVELSTDFDVETAYDSLFRGLLECLISSEKTGTEDGANWFLGALNHFICSKLLSPQLVSLYIDKIISHALELMGHSKHEKRNRFVHLGPLIQMIMQRYPEEFNAAIKSHKGMQSESSDADQTQKKLWQLLREAAELEDTLYSRGATENGTSLLLSLNHPSSEIRAAAIDTFDEVFTDDIINAGDFGADAIGLVDAVLRNLSGHDESVCTRGWNDSVVMKLAAIATPGHMALCITTAFQYWLDIAVKRPKKDGRNILNLILITLRNAELVTGLSECLVHSNCTFIVWLWSNLIALSNLVEGGFISNTIVSDDNTRESVSFFLKKYTTIQNDALAAMVTLGDTVPVFKIKAKARIVEFSDFTSNVAERLMRLVVDRDIEADAALKILAAIAAETVSGFAKLNVNNAPHIEKRNYFGVLQLLQKICSKLSQLESDPSEVPSVRSYFLCAHEIFCSVLVVLVPVEAALDISSYASVQLMTIYREYLSNDFSRVLKVEGTGNNSIIMKPFSVKYLHEDSPDCMLLLFFLSASTSHADIARLLGPLLMSGLVEKQQSSAFTLLCLISEIIVSNVGSSKFMHTTSSSIMSGQEAMKFWFYDPATGSSPVCSEIFRQENNVIGKLLVPAESKIAACQVLTNIIPMIDLSSGNGVTQMSQTVATICPLVVQLLSAQQLEFRRAGLLVCRQMLDIFKHLKLTEKLSLSFAENVSFVLKVNFDVNTIGLFCCLFVNSEELIVQDPVQTTQILSNNVFSGESTKLEYLRNLLLSVCITYGWSVPTVTSCVLKAVLLSCKKPGDLYGAWPYIKSLFMHCPVSNDVSAQSSDVLFLSELILRCLNYTVGTVKGAADTEVDVVESIINIITGPGEGRLMNAPTIQWLSLTGRNSGSEWCSNISQEHKVALFQALIAKSLKNPGSPGLIAALSLIPVDMSIIIKELLSHKKSIENTMETGNFGDLTEASDQITFMNFELDASDVASSLQLFYNALEAISPLIRVLLESVNADNAHNFGNCVCVLFDILGLIVNPKFSSLLVIEYCKGIILDSIQIILDTLTAGQFESTEIIAGKLKAPSKRIRQRSGSSSSLTSTDEDTFLYGSYPSSRVNNDTDCLFRVLQTSKLHQTQSSVLVVLNSLMKLSPKNVSLHAITTLSEILSNATLTSAAENTNALSVSADSTASLLRTILTTLTKYIRAETNISISGSSTTWDQIVQPLFAHFQSISQFRRAGLVRTAIDVLGDITLSSCASALLSHSFVSYCKEEVNTQDLQNSMDTVENQTIFTAVISRAAVKKAHRQVIVSPPQEFYQLALDTFLSCKNPMVQTATLVNLMSTAEELFDFGLNSFRGVSSSIKSSCYYVSMLLAPSREFNSIADPIKLAVLHLQFVFSVLENGTYHKLLAPHINGWELVDVITDESADIWTTPQVFFVQLCEKCLRFLASSVNAQQLEKREKIQSNTVPLSSMSKQAWKSCVDIIDSLQRLLDGPTFLALLQNLLVHEQPAVRQKALQILASRLEQLTTERDDVESSLYIGLIQRIKESLDSAVVVLSDKNALIKDDKRTMTSHVISLAQSGVLCIDLLARHVSQDKDSSWHPQLEDCLDVQLKLMNKIILCTTDCIEPNALVVSCDDAIYAELLRMQGSVLLSSVTVFSTLGTKVLPKLADILDSVFVSIKSHAASLLSVSSKRSEVTGSSNKNKRHKKSELQAVSTAPTNRSRVLLLRSAVASIATLASAMPNFMHPYIEDSIVLSLSICKINFGASGVQIEGYAEENGTILNKEVYRNMVVLVSSIPPRLCIPRLVSTSHRLKEMIKLVDKHDMPMYLIVLVRFVELVSEYWSFMDRLSVANNISQIGPLMIDIMGYRHNCEVQSDLSRALDSKVAGACVQLCMKLTEAEVRAFLVHAAEWMSADRNDSEDDDSDSPDQRNWLGSTKAVAFFHCVAALNDKLKSVFTASMGCIWDTAVEKLAEVVQTLKSSKLSVPKPRDDDKILKKRKDLSAENQEEKLKIIHEMVLLATDILNSIRNCSLYDKIGFVDEERYGLVISNAVALLASRKWFASDSEYESFCLDTVVPCFTSLSIAIGKDTLWKPMNHAILLLTRDKKKVVRVVGVKALHHLFSNVRLLCFSRLLFTFNLSYSLRIFLTTRLARSILSFFLNRSRFYPSF